MVDLRKVHYVETEASRWICLTCKHYMSEGQRTHCTHPTPPIGLYMDNEVEPWGYCDYWDDAEEVSDG